MNKPQTIQSILDLDFYYLTQQNAIEKLYPNAIATYEFINRNKNDKFNSVFFDKLNEEIESIGNLKNDSKTIGWLGDKCKFLSPSYLQFLESYKFDPKYVKTELTNDKDLKIKIEGPWHQTILWQNLLQVVSELYYKIIKTDWDSNSQKDRILNKKYQLDNVRYSEFGVRRRRSFETQYNVVKNLLDSSGFVGTSNVHLSHEFGLIPKGTVAHEWFMGHQALTSILHCNKYALEAWNKVYKGDLGIALTDTIGTKFFFNDFDPVLSRLFDGVRHDSGCPFKFTDKAVEHYKAMNIDPSTKTALFSNGLKVKEALEINSYCKNKMIPAFGIGTHFTNDFEDRHALNIVIKLTHLNGFPVVKTSDDAGKESGDGDAVRVVKWLTNRTPLDQK